MMSSKKKPIGNQLSAWLKPSRWVHPTAQTASERSSSAETMRPARICSASVRVSPRSRADCSHTPTSSQADIPSTAMPRNERWSGSGVSLRSAQATTAPKITAK
jgi:hypothetical protein